MAALLEFSSLAASFVTVLVNGVLIFFHPFHSQVRLCVLLVKLSK